MTLASPTVHCMPLRLHRWPTTLRHPTSTIPEGHTEALGAELRADHALVIAGEVIAFMWASL